MIVTELYNGQGLGNQLWCYVVTRVIAADQGYKFGIMHPEKCKSLDFMNLDFGETVIGGTGPEGGPPTTLPEGITHYYNERALFHPTTGVDIRTYDHDLISVPDNTKIDGYMQDENYILHQKDEIREWLKVRPEAECFDYASNNICVLNFRGGEYLGIPHVLLPQEYWDMAIGHMRRINPDIQFIVITDDPCVAKKFFPNFPVLHFSIGKDYSIIKNAKYLVLSNSTFAWFPAWLSISLEYCIAPKYWSQFNTSDGYWGLGYNLTRGWMYLNRTGTLQSYEECLIDMKAYAEGARDLTPPLIEKRTLWIFQKNMERKAKKLFKIIKRKAVAFFA